MAAVVDFLDIAVFSHSIPEKASEDCTIAIVALSTVAYKSHNTSVHFTSCCILVDFIYFYIFHIFLIFSCILCIFIYLVLL